MYCSLLASHWLDPKLRKCAKKNRNNSIIEREKALLLVLLDAHLDLCQGPDLRSGAAIRYGRPGVEGNVSGIHVHRQ